MVKITYAGYLGLPPAISAQFTLEMCVAAWKSRKIHKTPYFRNSRSLILTPLRSSSPVLVMICSMSVPICNHFHARPANSGKITSFRGGGMLLFPPSFEGTPSPSSMKFGHKIPETLSYHMVKIRSL